MSSKTHKNPTEQKNELDPRIASYLFGGGPDGNKGMLQTGYDLSQQPALNPRMQQGLDSQYNYLNSSMYSNIFNQMAGQGSNLMSRGVAGNPFMQSGGMRPPSMFGGYKPDYTPQGGGQGGNPQGGMGDMGSYGGGMGGGANFWDMMKNQRR